MFLCCNIVVFEEARMMETVPESGLKKKGCVRAVRKCDGLIRMTEATGAGMAKV